MNIVTSDTLCVRITPSPRLLVSPSCRPPSFILPVLLFPAVCEKDLSPLVELFLSPLVRVRLPNWPENFCSDKSNSNDAARSRRPKIEA